LVWVQLVSRALQILVQWLLLGRRKDSGLRVIQVLITQIIGEDTTDNRPPVNRVQQMVSTRVLLEMYKQPSPFRS